MLKGNVMPKERGIYTPAFALGRAVRIAAGTAI